MTEQPNRRNKVIFITGFGNFHGVTDNPSSILVDELRIGGVPGAENATLSFEGNFQVLTVDVPHCQAYFEGIPPCADGDIFVHIGVNGKADCIHLEKCAYNNMDFRVADESGFQPLNELISPESCLDDALETDLDVNRIATELKADNFPFAVSTDPGRFICNYIFYLSLQNFTRFGYSKKSLFVHIPPFEKLDKETQLVALQRLVAKLAREYL